MKKILIIIIILSSEVLISQSIIIPTGASIYVPAGADICAGIYGNITGNIFGEGTQCNNSPVPVELSQFSATSIGTNIKLSWKTETEINNYGFEVERKINSEWQTITFVNGYGNSNSPKEYSYVDKNPIGGNKFIYRLKQIDNDGVYEYSSEVEVTITPYKFELFQNYPNPFNPVTKIRYQLPIKSTVSILIYNILGSEVFIFREAEKEPGIYELEFNAGSLPSGSYIYRIQAGNFVDTKKMILMK